MNSRQKLVLFAIALLTFLIDIFLQARHHIAVDGKSFLGVAVTLVLVLTIGFIVARFGDKSATDAATSGMVFTLLFSPSCAAMSYFLFAAPGPRIDYLLANIDRRIGFDWPAIMAWAAQHPFVNSALFYAYIASEFEVVLLIIVLSFAMPARIFELCIAIALGALATVWLWALAPSFGAFSVYELPASVTSNLHLALDANYGKRLVQMLSNGPGIINAHNIKGVAGFPSFHAAEALIVTYYARGRLALFLPVLLFNIVAMISTPIQGGHHIVDLIGGAAVAFFGVAAATYVARWSVSPKNQPRAIVGTSLQ